MEESYVFSAAFAGLTFASVRMHLKKASRSRFVKDVATEVGRVAERTGLKRSPSSISAKFGSVQVREEVSPALTGRGARTSPKCRLQLSGSLGMEIDGVRCFLILSDNRALVLALCKGRSCFTLLSDMQRVVLPSRIRASCLTIVAQVDTSQS